MVITKPSKVALKNESTDNNKSSIRQDATWMDEPLTTEESRVENGNEYLRRKI